MCWVHVYNCLKKNETMYYLLVSKEALMKDKSLMLKYFSPHVVCHNYLYTMHFAEQRNHYDRFKPEMESTAGFTHGGSHGA